MADNKKPIDSLLEKIDDYVKTSIELAKYKAIDKISNVIVTLIPYLFESLIILFFIFFLNLGLALWLGFILGKTYLGFAAVSLSKRIFKGPSTGAFRKILGTLLESGLTGFIAQHSDAIRSFGESLFKFLLHRKEPESAKS